MTLGIAVICAVGAGVAATGGASGGGGNSFGFLQPENATKATSKKAGTRILFRICNVVLPSKKINASIPVIRRSLSCLLCALLKIVIYVAISIQPDLHPTRTSHIAQPMPQNHEPCFANQTGYPALPQCTSFAERIVPLNLVNDKNHRTSSSASSQNRVPIGDQAHRFRYVARLLPAPIGH
jgi:hypothetical protein